MQVHGNTICLQVHSRGEIPPEVHAVVDSADGLGDLVCDRLYVWWEPQAGGGQRSQVGTAGQVGRPEQVAAIKQDARAGAVPRPDCVNVGARLRQEAHQRGLQVQL